MNVSYKYHIPEKYIKNLINNFSKKLSQKCNKYECNNSASEDAYKKLQKIYKTYV